MRKLTLIILVLFLIGCGGADAAPENEGETAVSGLDPTAAALATAIVASAEPPVSFEGLAQQLDDAEALWQSHNIRSYHVEVRHRQPGWNTQIIDLVVTDGVVTDVTQSCFPERDCILREVDPQMMTIEAIYGVARNVLTLQDPATQMTFNPTYGYPNLVGYEDASWVYGEFELLDPAP